MKPIINALYINLQYAEIPPQNIAKLVNISYRPVLKELNKRKDKFLLGITGRSIEILAQEYPDVLKLVQKLTKDKKMEIMGGTYSNPPLALLPLDSQQRQIKTHLQMLKKYFRAKPEGFCPPEYTWDPILPELLKKFGIRWSIICQHQIDFSKRSNEFAAILMHRPEYSANAWLDVAYRSIVRKILNLPKIYHLFNQELKVLDHDLFKILAVNDDILGFKSIRTWTGFIIAAAGKSFLQSKTKLRNLLDYQANHAKGLFFPYFGDLENINYRGNSPLEFKLKDLIYYLDLIGKNKKFYYQFPSDYLKKNSPENSYYIKTSSGEPSTSLNIWERDPDSMRIEKICQEVREKLRPLRSNLKKHRVEKLLMLAENGDGRGWNPVPERRLECFKAALSALKLLD